MNDAVPRRSLLSRLVRFIAWVIVAIGGLVFLSTASSFVPCLMGEPGGCVSGLLFLAGFVIALAFVGTGALLLFVTRRRPTPA